MKGFSEKNQNKKESLPELFDEERFLLDPLNLDQNEQTQWTKSFSLEATQAPIRLKILANGETTEADVESSLVFSPLSFQDPRLISPGPALEQLAGEFFEISNGHHSLRPLLHLKMEKFNFSKKSVESPNDIYSIPDIAEYCPKKMSGFGPEEKEICEKSTIRAVEENNKKGFLVDELLNKLKEIADKDDFKKKLSSKQDVDEMLEVNLQFLN